MALVVKDRVKETSTSTGTGNFTLAGAIAGFQAFSAALANGDTTYYAITDAGTGDFEVGLGTYNAGVLTRTTILESTNAGAAVNFQAGEKEVFITYPAEKAVYADASGNISVPGLVDGRDLAADGSKLDGIEAGATADQTGAEIKSLYEAQANTNAYTDADKSKLAGIEAGATADQTAAEIKTAYESNANTNAFTDAEQSKLAGIEAGATADQTASEILTAIKTVDGSASGLDADLLDGQEGSYYTGYTDTAAAAKVSKTGDTMTGALDVQSTITADGLTVDGDVTINGGDILIQNTAGTNYLRFYEDLETLFGTGNVMPYDPLNAFSGGSLVTGSAGLVHYSQLDAGDGEPSSTNDAIGFVNYTSINNSVADTTTDQQYGIYNSLTQEASSNFSNLLVGMRNEVIPLAGEHNNSYGLWNRIANISELGGAETSNVYYGVIGQAVISPATTSTSGSSLAVTQAVGGYDLLNVSLFDTTDVNLSATTLKGGATSVNITNRDLGTGAVAVTTLKGFDNAIYLRNYGTSTATNPISITNVYGYYLDNTYQAAGSVGNFYGLYLEDFSGSVTGLNYAIYAAGGDTYLNGNLETTGNITVGGTVDGRDIAADGTKLDGIEAGATADQTKADIDALGIDAATLGGNTAAYFTGYTDTAVAALVDAAPGTLDTLNELAAALGDDPNFATTVTNSIATKVSKSGDTMTGNLTVPNLGIGTTSITDTSWGTGNKELAIDGTTGYGIIHLRGTGAGSVDTRYSIGVGDSIFYMAWDDVDGVHRAKINASHQLILNEGSGDQRAFHDGYHPNADKLTTARNIALTGDVTGSANFDGSANISITATVADDSHNHVISNVDGLQAALDAKLNSSSYTAADVLTKVKTVDGAGSGLDADLLDGQHGSYYYSPANPPPAGGAVGGGSDEVFWENDQVVTTSYTITNGKNAGSFGPITINSGVTVTVGAGEVWTVV